MSIAYFIVDVMFQILVSPRGSIDAQKQLGVYWGPPKEGSTVEAGAEE